MTGDPSCLAAELAADLQPSETTAYANFAIRTRSPMAREVLAAAGEGAALGRVIALSEEPRAHERGLATLDAVVARSGSASLPQDALTIWAGLLLEGGRDEELRALLDDADAELTDRDRWMLRTDLLNPYRQVSLTGEEFDAAERQWLRTFNEVHAADGLEPIRLRPTTASRSPYQLLEAPVDDRIDEDPVTVVMSAYRPNRDLLLAVRGVMDQTWANLELLVVDDASPPKFHDLFDEAEAFDPRVRVVRAPRNRGTYEARNLALSLASGRWMTFQDSDDWTHPRRVEHQVRHLQEAPQVLANRSWTLRAFADLTMSFVGYPAMRLNASSLLFDREQVSKLVGEFDSTRKTGDMELPFRLRAVRPGSVRDLPHPAPLAITQLRPSSLSRDDALPGWIRWDRLAYRDSYLEWHQQIAGRKLDPVLPLPSGRPFPLPRPSWQPDGEPDVPPPDWDVVVLGDLRPVGDGHKRAMGVARRASHADLHTAVAHAETAQPLVEKRVPLTPELSTAARLGHLGLTDAHEQDGCRLLIITDPTCVLHLDDAALRVRTVLVIADDPAPTAWGVAAVERRCEELFGVVPAWGGPTGVHDGPDGPSPVRRAVPDERWCADDLSVVADVGRLGVAAIPGPSPIRRRQLGAPIRPFVVVGHHLEDDPRRWPANRDDVRAAYPDELTFTAHTEGADSLDLPVELHCLGRVRTPTRLLGQHKQPPSWSSFAGTTMTLREYLSHIDIWVYFGEWDAAAQIATLEALDAGLPCVLGDHATVRDLRGPVRCTSPEHAREAMEELLTMPPDPTDPFGQRHAAWTRTLHRFLPAVESTPTSRRTLERAASTEPTQDDSRGTHL